MCGSILIWKRLEYMKRGTPRSNGLAERNQQQYSEDRFTAYMWVYSDVEETYEHEMMHA